MMAVLLGYVSLAATLDVTLVFAAFLAGFGIMGGMRSTEQGRFQVPMTAINQMGGYFFIPVYFALIGYRLDFSKTFDPVMLAGFLVGTSLVCLLAVGLGARLAGMNWLDVANIAITTNARGGPGIVMASVAFDAGIINGAFFTTLVVTAVLTSQAAASGSTSCCGRAGRSSRAPTSPGAASSPPPKRRRPARPNWSVW